MHTYVCQLVARISLLLASSLRTRKVYASLRCFSYCQLPPSPTPPPTLSIGRDRKKGKGEDDRDQFACFHGLSSLCCSSMFQGQCMWLTSRSLAVVLSYQLCASTLYQCAFRNRSLVTEGDRHGVGATTFAPSTKT